MKKVLLTTALASLFASSALSADMQVKIGGTTDFEAGYVKYSNDGVGEMNAAKTASANQKHVKFRNRASLYVNAHAKTENGLSFGANVRVKPEIQENLKYKDGKFDSSYIWLESSFGRVELGSNVSAVKLMKIGAESVAAATGGASDGNWVAFADLKGAGLGVGDTQLSEEASMAIKSGNTILNRNNASEHVRKISWISPSYSGLQVGASYSPDGNNAGYNSVTSTTGPHPKLKNLIAVAASYKKSFNDVNVAGSYGFEHAKDTTVVGGGDGTKKNLNSHSLGLMATKGPMSIAASYGTNGKSRLVTVNAANQAALDAFNKGQKSYYFTLGAAYEQGPMKASLTYLNSKAGKKQLNLAAPAITANHANLSVYSAGLDYKIASGMKAFAEFNHFNMKSSENGNDNTSNKGTVVLVGTKLSF